MDGVVNSIFRFLLPSEISLKNEKLLKNIEKFSFIAWLTKCCSNYL